VLHAGAIAAIEAKRDREQHIIKPSRVDDFVRSAKERGTPLSSEQEAALRYLLQEKGAFQSVCGRPGTGKNVVLQAAAAAWKLEGFDVRGVTLSGRASREFARTTGIATQTLAKALHDLAPSPRET